MTYPTTALQIATIAAETLKAYGARTPERLASLVEFYGSSYFGGPLGRPVEHQAIIDDAFNYARTMLVKPYQWTA